MRKFSGKFSGSGKTLRIKDAFKEDAGKGRVRMDPKIVKQLGLLNGEVIEIFHPGTNKKTAGLLYPGKEEDTDSKIIRLEPSLRRNLGAALDDVVSIRKIAVELAEKVTFAGVKQVVLAKDAQQLSRTLENRVLTKNDIISFYNWSGRVDLIVVDYYPRVDAVLIQIDTEIVMSEKSYKELIEFEKSGISSKAFRELKKRIQRFTDYEIDTTNTNMEKFIRQIIEGTGLKRDEVQNLLDQKLEELHRLISEKAALILVARELGVDIEINNKEESRNFDQKKSFIPSVSDNLKKKTSERNVFKVNEYITLKLEKDTTNIYVQDQIFQQCKSLLFTIPVNEISSLEDIESIDEAAVRFRWNSKIDPETEFWGHCSNLQVWIENNYDTRLLHSNLAFPLLKALVDAGDPIAQKVFKEEIAKRISSNFPNVVLFLLYEKFLNYLTVNELEPLIVDIMSIIKKLDDDEHKEYAIEYLMEVMRDNGLLKDNLFQILNMINDIKYGSKLFEFWLDIVQDNGLLKCNFPELLNLINNMKYSSKLIAFKSLISKVKSTELLEKIIPAYLLILKGIWIQEDKVWAFKSLLEAIENTELLKENFLELLKFVDDMPTNSHDTAFDFFLKALNTKILEENFPRLLDYVININRPRNDAFTLLLLNLKEGGLLEKKFPTILHTVENVKNYEKRTYIFQDLMERIKDTELLSTYASQIKKLTKEVVKIVKDKDDFRSLLYAVLKTELLKENFPGFINIIKDMENTEDKCRAFDDLLTYGLRGNDLLKESYLSLLNILEDMENVDCKVYSFRLLLDKMNEHKLVSKVLPRIEAITGDVIDIIKNMSNAKHKVNVSESLQRTLKKTRIKTLQNFALKIEPSIRDKINEVKEEKDTYFKIVHLKSLLKEIANTELSKEDFMALLSVIKQLSLDDKEKREWERSLTTFEMERSKLFLLLIDTVKDMDLELSEENFKSLLIIIKDMGAMYLLEKLILEENFPRLVDTKLLKNNFIVLLKALKGMNAIRTKVFKSLLSELDRQSSILYDLYLYELDRQSSIDIILLKKKFIFLLDLVAMESTLDSHNVLPNPDIIYQVSEIIDIIKDIDKNSAKINIFLLLLYILKITKLLDNFSVQIETLTKEIAILIEDMRDDVGKAEAFRSLLKELKDTKLLNTLSSEIANLTELIILMVKNMEDRIDKICSLRYLLFALKGSDLLTIYSSSIEELVLDCIEAMKDLKERNDRDLKSARHNRSSLGGAYEILLEAIQDTYLWEKYYAQISRILIIEGVYDFDYKDVVEMKIMFDDYEYEGSIWKIYEIYEIPYRGDQIQFIIANRKPTIRQLKSYSKFFDFLEASDKSNIRRTDSMEYI